MKKTCALIMLALLLCGLVWLAVPEPAFADDDVMPLDLYVVKLGISGNIDVVTGKLTANVSVTTGEKCEIYTTMDVYKSVDGDWELFKSFRNPRKGVVTGQMASYSDSCKVDKGYDYYVIATAYVTSVKDQVSETVSQSSTIFSYK